MFNECTSLENQLDSKNNEIHYLRIELNNLVDQNNRLVDDKNELEKIVIELRDIRQKNILEKDKLEEEKLSLVKNLKEEGNLIKDLELERNKLIDINDNLKLEITNLTSKIRTRDESLNYHQKQLDENNKTISLLNNQLKDLEFNNEKLIDELNTMDNVNEREIKTRNDLEKSYEDLEMKLKDRERNLKNMSDDMDLLQDEKDKLFDDNSKMFVEIDRLKSHIFVITDQNKRVKKFFDNFSYFFNGLFFYLAL